MPATSSILHDLSRNGRALYGNRDELGQPAKMWRLTAAADRFFPDAHADLTVGLLRSIQDAFGKKGMERLLAVRAEEMTATYAKSQPKTDSLKRRLRALAKIRTEEGYMAEVRTAENGGLLFVENHCPIREAAAECQGALRKRVGGLSVCPRARSEGGTD